MTDAEYEKLVERAARAFRAVDEPDLSAGLLLEYQMRAALDAVGHRELVEAAEECLRRGTFFFPCRDDGEPDPDDRLRAALTQEQDT